MDQSGNQFKSILGLVFLSSLFHTFQFPGFSSLFTGFSGVGWEVEDSDNPSSEILKQNYY